MPLRVVFFGTPRFAVPTLRALLTSRHSVALVVTQPDRPRGRGQRLSEGPVKALALAQGIPVSQPERLRDAPFLDQLSHANVDLGVVAAYGRILPEAVLAIPRIGLINVHASLLPRYRGAAPIHRAVMAGDRTTGVTIMRVVPALDAGPMLASVAREIGPDATSEDIEAELAIDGARLLVDVVDRLADGPIDEVPQDEALVTYAPRITKEEGLIDWTRPADQIHNRVRGLYPWPHAFTFSGGERFVLLRTAIPAASSMIAASRSASSVGSATLPASSVGPATPPASSVGPATPPASSVGPASLPAALDITVAPIPGTVLVAHGDTLRIATGDTAIDVLEIQPDGRRPMPIRAFLAGHRLAAGARLGRPPT